MTIAILALQGAFAEHQQMLSSMNVESRLIRYLPDWDEYIASPGPHALIIPGGESTAMMRIIKDENLFEPVRKAILEGMPVFGTCAGLIMLDKEHLDVMDIMAKRNAYGRQLGSFRTDAAFEGLGTIPMTFIRAPYIETAGAGVDVLSVVDGRIVAARQGNMLVTAFHPELNDDQSVHRLFISMVEGR